MLQYIIIDEAQRLKERNSKLSRDLDSFRAKYRLLLTGTPLQVGGWLCGLGRVAAMRAGPPATPSAAFHGHAPSSHVFTPARPCRARGTGCRLHRLLCMLAPSFH